MGLGLKVEGLGYRFLGLGNEGSGCRNPAQRGVAERLPGVGHCQMPKSLIMDPKSRTLHPKP
jgi:hypothetical protein